MNENNLEKNDIINVVIKNEMILCDWYDILCKIVLCDVIKMRLNIIDVGWYNMI